MHGLVFKAERTGKFSQMGSKKKNVFYLDNLLIYSAFRTFCPQSRQANKSLGCLLLTRCLNQDLIALAEYPMAMKQPRLARPGACRSQKGELEAIQSPMASVILRD